MTPNIRRQFRFLHLAMQFLRTPPAAPPPCPPACATNPGTAHKVPT
ncbi:MAG TPA: hypothetical protein VN893_02415 [Bryobacteraceae bacterium]|nr:hypothetical protein [Bryobacteraceae bacterium]